MGALTIDAFIHPVFDHIQALCLSIGAADVAKGRESFLRTRTDGAFDPDFVISQPTPFVPGTFGTRTVRGGTESVGRYSCRGPRLVRDETWGVHVVGRPGWKGHYLLQLAPYLREIPMAARGDQLEDKGSR